MLLHLLLHLADLAMRCWPAGPSVSETRYVVAWSAMPDQEAVVAIMEDAVVSEETEGVSNDG